MNTTRQIAAELAKTIATTDWIPEGVGKPRVFMDAITTAVTLGEHPAVIVVPRNSTGMWHANPEYQIEVVLAMDASSLNANPAAPVETPDGVEVYGSGALLDSMVVALVNTIKRATPGSILADLQVEYSLDSLPMQYATITLGYRDNPSYDTFED